MLGRGVAFVRGAESAALADLALVAILRLHEELAHTQVTVDDETQALVDPSQLVEQEVWLLDAYLRDRDGRDPSCLATARAHIGLCLKAREQLTPLAWETLERIAHQRGSDLLAENPYAERAAQDAAVQPGDLELLIRPYAERAGWDGYLMQAAEVLDYADLHTEPFLWVEGHDWIDSLESSSAWELIGYGAIVGFHDQQPYGVLVHNDAPRSNHLAHLVICDPAKHRLYELFQRAADHCWISRTYSPVTEGTVDDASKFGVQGILDAGTSRTPFAVVSDLSSLAGELLAVKR